MGDVGSIANLVPDRGKAENLSNQPRLWQGTSLSPGTIIDRTGFLVSSHIARREGLDKNIEG